LLHFHIFAFDGGVQFAFGVTLGKGGHVLRRNGFTICEREEDDGQNICRALFYFLFFFSGCNESGYGQCIWYGSKREVVRPFVNHEQDD